MDLIGSCEPPTQTAFAARVGVRQSVVSEWVCNGVIPSPKKRAQICEAFGIDRAELEARARGYRLDPDAPPPKGDDGPSVPLVNLAPAGNMGWYCELGPTTEASPDRVTVPWLPASRNIFAVRIAGDSMEPTLHDGWIGFFRWLDRHQDSPESIEPGSIVYVQASAESDNPEECCIALWSFDQEGGTATLTKAAKGYRKWRCIMPREHIQQVAVFVGTMPRLGY